MAGLGGGRGLALRARRASARQRSACAAMVARPGCASATKSAGWLARCAIVSTGPHAAPRSKLTGALKHEGNRVAVVVGLERHDVVAAGALEHLGQVGQAHACGVGGRGATRLSASTRGTQWRATPAPCPLGLAQGGPPPPWHKNNIQGAWAEGPTPASHGILNSSSARADHAPSPSPLQGPLAPGRPPKLRGAHPCSLGGRSGSARRRPSAGAWRSATHGWCPSPAGRSRCCSRRCWHR